MIKGVNRHIIEVTNTGSVYYERALLVLRPEYSSVERELLEKEARKLIRGMAAPSSIKKKRAIILWLVRFSISALIGALIMYFIR
ncbi:MAG: hypothetical protein ACI4II_10055 [Acutalibacteraceae bacterium]